MSTDPFGRLMERFGNEAESERLEEARKIEQKKKAAKIKKAVFVLILLGISVASWLNRNALSAKVMNLYNSTMGTAYSVTKNGEETKNKAKEIKDGAAKRDAVLNDILK